MYASRKSVIVQRTPVGDDFAAATEAGIQATVRVVSRQRDVLGVSKARRDNFAIGLYRYRCGFRLRGIAAGRSKSGGQDFATRAPPVPILPETPTTDELE